MQEGTLDSPRIELMGFKRSEICLLTELVHLDLRVQ
jgi:hypothetical protein